METKRTVNGIWERFLVPLTFSTLMGQNRGLRNWYPIMGSMQRITVRKTLIHNCGWIRVFRATPVSKEPGGPRLRQSPEEEATSRNLDSPPGGGRGQSSLLR